MNKFYWLLFLTFTISCTSGVDIKTNLIDSLAKQRRIDSIKKDSIIKVDQSRVIGGITFGISEDRFNKLQRLFMKSSAKRKDWDWDQYFIGDYEFMKVEGLFYNDSLYSVWVSGDLVHYDDYKSELISQVDILLNMLSKKYGSPTHSTGPPAWHLTENDYNYPAYIWNVGTKSIEIRVSDRGLYYSADLKFYQPSIEHIVKKEQDISQEQKAESAKDVF